MKSKYGVILVIVLISVPFSYFASCLEPNYWPVAKGDTLNYRYQNCNWERCFFDGEINLTINNIHENGIIDYQTDVVDGDWFNMTPSLIMSISTEDNLTLEFEEKIILYSADEYAKIKWESDFEDVQNYWKPQTILYEFRGRLKSNGFEFTVTRKSDNERYTNLEIEYTKEGILRSYKFGEIRVYNDGEGNYNSYFTEEWVLLRNINYPILGYLVFSLAMIGLGAIGVKIGLMWKKDRISN